MLSKDYELFFFFFFSSAFFLLLEIERMIDVEG